MPMSWLMPAFCVHRSALAERIAVELAAGVISDHLPAIRLGTGLVDLEARYRTAYKARFHSRLRVCSMIRRAAFVPGLAQMAIRVFGTSDLLRRRLSRATRGGTPETYCLSQRLNDSGSSRARPV